MHPTAVKQLAMLAMSFTACQSLQVVKIAKDLAARIETRGNYDPHGNWDPHSQPNDHESYTNSVKIRHTREDNANIEVRAPKRGGSSSSDSDSSSSSGGSSSSSGGGGSSCKTGSCSYSEKPCNGGCIPQSATCCTASTTSQYCQSNKICRQRVSSLYYCCPQSNPNCDYFDTQADLTLYGSSSYCSSSGDSGAAGTGISAGALVAAGVVAGAANLMV